MPAPKLKPGDKVSAAPGPGRKRGTKKKALTPRQWGEAEMLYAAGDMSAAALAAKFSVNIRTIVEHMRKKGVKAGAKAAEAAKTAADAVERNLTEEAEILARRIKETRDQHYTMSANLGKLVWAEVLEARQAGVPIATRGANLKSLDIAISALKKVREERFAVLGLDRPDASDPAEIPELVVSELTAEQIEKIRNAQEADSDDEELELDVQPAAPLGDDAGAEEDDVQEEGAD